MVTLFRPLSSYTNKSKHTILNDEVEIFKNLNWMKNKHKIIVSSKHLGEIYSGWGNFSETLAGFLLDNNCEVVFHGKEFYSISAAQKKDKNSLWRTISFLIKSRMVFFPNFYDFNYIRILVYRFIFFKKVVVRICANELKYRRPIKLKVMVWIMNHCHKVIVLNLEKKQYLEEILASNKKVVFIPNPVSAFYLYYNNPKPENERNNIVFVGSICQRKGVIELIRAYIKTNFKNSHKLLLYGPVGYGESTPEYLETVRTTAGKLLNSKIHIYDAVSKEQLRQVYLKNRVSFSQATRKECQMFY